MSSTDWKRHRRPTLSKVARTINSWRRKSLARNSAEHDILPPSAWLRFLTEFLRSCAGYFEPRKKRHRRNTNNASMIAHIGEQTRSHRRCFTARCRRLEPRITHDQARGNSSRPLKNPLSSRGTSLKRRRPHCTERGGLILYSRNSCSLNGSHPRYQLHERFRRMPRESRTIRP